jgi:hypothetical protein
MDIKNMLLASIIGGLISTFLSNVPIINFINCLFCAGFWIGPILAVWFYRKQTGTLTFSQALGIGAITGVWAGGFGLILSLVGLAGAEALMKSYTQFIPSDANTGGVTNPSVSFLLTMVGVGINILFGAIGGLVAGLFFRSRPL